MRSDLVPEKRRDRNGVLRTVYVRADARSAGTRMLPPAPAPAAAVPQPDPAAARFPGVLLDMHARRVKTEVYGADLTPPNSLLDAIGRRTGMREHKAHFQFECTPLQFCDVLSVVSPDTAVALLDAGFTDSGAVREFLDDAELEDLIEDNLDVAAGILRTSALPSDALDRFLSMSDSFYDDPERFEGSLRERLQRKLQMNRVAWGAIERGEINVGDIVEIGVSRFLNAESESDQLAELLAKAARDPEAPVRAEHISDWIERFSIGTISGAAYKNLVYSLCTEFGPDFASEIPMDFPAAVDGVHRLYWETVNTVPDRDRRREAIQFGAEVMSIVAAEDRRSMPSPVELCRLPPGVMSPREAADAFLAGLTAEQIISSQRDGIAPGLSSGAL